MISVPVQIMGETEVYPMTIFRVAQLDYKDKEVRLKLLAVKTENFDPKDANKKHFIVVIDCDYQSISAINDICEKQKISELLNLLSRHGILGKDPSTVSFCLCFDKDESGYKENHAKFTSELRVWLAKKIECQERFCIITANGPHAEGLNALYDEIAARYSPTEKYNAEGAESFKAVFYASLKEYAEGTFGVTFFRHHQDKIKDIIALLEKNPPDYINAMNELAKYVDSNLNSIKKTGSFITLINEINSAAQKFGIVYKINTSNKSLTKDEDLSKPSPQAPTSAVTFSENKYDEKAYPAPPVKGVQKKIEPFDVIEDGKEKDKETQVKTNHPKV